MITEKNSYTNFLPYTKLFEVFGIDIISLKPNEKKKKSCYFFEKFNDIFILNSIFFDDIRCLSEN